MFPVINNLASGPPLFIQHIKLPRYVIPALTGNVDLFLLGWLASFLFLGWFISSRLADIISILAAILAKVSKWGLIANLKWNNNFFTLNETLDLINIQWWSEWRKHLNNRLLLVWYSTGSMIFRPPFEYQSKFSPVFWWYNHMLHWFLQKFVF